MFNSSLSNYSGHSSLDISRAAAPLTIKVWPQTLLPPLLPNPSVDAVTSLTKRKQDSEKPKEGPAERQKVQKVRHQQAPQRRPMRQARVLLRYVKRLYWCWASRSAFAKSSSGPSKGETRRQMTILARFLVRSALERIPNPSVAAP